MDNISTWSLKIAEEVAPNEIDLAPFMAQAFLEGGKEREQMFQPPIEGGTLGGFGAGEAVVIFPYVLKGLAEAAPILSVMLAATPYIKDFISIVKDSLAIQKQLAEMRNPKPQTLPDDKYSLLKRTFDTLEKELQLLPISYEKRCLIAYRTLHALLQDPSSASHFVIKVGAISNG